MSQVPDHSRPDQSVILHVVTENQDGVTTEGDVSFEQTADGWRRTLPDNLIVPVIDFLNRPAGPK
jgi:hypothetical protein